MHRQMQDTERERDTYAYIGTDRNSGFDFFLCVDAKQVMRRDE